MYAPETRLREIPEREPLPEEIARRFLEGTLEDPRRRLHDLDGRMVYRWLDRPAMVASIKDGRLIVDYHTLPAKAHWPDEMHFEYWRRAPNDVFGNPVAEMHLTMHSPERAELKHRLVREEGARRRDKIGSLLFAEPEGWLRQVAHLSGRPITLEMEIGQVHVVQWADTLGFDAAETSKDLVSEILAHPERFSEHKADAWQIFRVDAEGNLGEKGERVSLKKIIEP